MSEFLEIELKNLLTHEEYQNLILYFKRFNENMIKQTNIYLDTESLNLKKQKAALRLRLKDDIIEFTLKQENEIGNLETTDIISEQDLANLLSNRIIPSGTVSEKLAKADIKDPLLELARLRTYRYEFRYRDTLIALDKSEYYGNTDYELELETDDYEHGKKVFNDILNKYNIPKRETKHKIVRACEYKNKSSN